MVQQITRGRTGRLLGASLLALTVAACRQDMHDQPKYTALQESNFFGDGQASRPLVANTVARGQLNEDTLLMTGQENGADTTVFPFPVTDEVMNRGHERFDVFCSPCHGRTGSGDGMIVRRGYRRPPMLGEQRLIDAPVGHIFDVITNGFGAMPDYSEQIPVRDRWAIVAYVRALQLSSHATVEDVPAAERPKLDENRTNGAAGAQAPQTERH